MLRGALNPSCPRCGGPVEVPEGAAYARCGFCSSESFVDLTGAILHQAFRAVVSRSRVPRLVGAAALEAGWVDATVSGFELVYEPVWEIEGPDGQRLRIGARPDQSGRFSLVGLPGGERGFVDAHEEAGGEWIQPELAPESVPEVAARVTGRPVMVKGLRLIHRPVYSGDVVLAGERRGFTVDAVSGEVLQSDWPQRVTRERRNRFWLASAVMIVAGTVLPIHFAAPAVAGIMGLTLWTTRERSARSSARA